MDNVTLLIQNEEESVVESDMNNSSIFDLSDSDINYFLSDKTEEEYLNDYCWIIDNGLKRGLNKYKLRGYYEKHHILPRCMGGEDENYNYVLLTALEHIIVHIILYKLYSDNINLLYSIQRTARPGLTSQSLMSINRRDACSKIPDILKIISKFRENHRNSLVKAVVCYDIKTNKVIRVYEDGVISSKKDGFSYKNIGSVLSKKRNTVGGYGWSELKNFEKSHKSELDEYYNNLSNDIIPDINNTRDNIMESIKLLRNDTGKRIVCCDIDKNIIKIYNSITDTISDGFSNIILSKIINNDNISKFHRGYYWELYDKFILENPEKLINYKEYEVHSIIKDNRIICCDLNFNIIKIYSELKDINKDGFCNTTLCGILTSGGIFYRGYNWYKFTDWGDKNSIETYYASDNKKSPTPKAIKNDPTAVVNCDSDGNIIGIYSNMHEADRISGISYKGISHAANSKSHRYKNSYWYKLGDYNNKFNSKI